MSHKLLTIGPRFEQTLRRVAEKVIADARSGRATPSAAEWLLENFSYLRLQAREVTEAIPRGYYKRLPRSADVPRVYSAVQELVASGEGLDQRRIHTFFENRQASGPLQLGELWAIRPLLKLALLDQLGSAIDPGPLESDGKLELIKRVITGLRHLDDVEWAELVESLSAIDLVLRQDPAQVYPRMEFETRDRYRRAVERIARLGKCDEPGVARAAIELACNAAQAPIEAARHVGYYLVDDGVAHLRKAVGARRSFGEFVRDALCRVPALAYISAVAAAMGLALWAVDRIAGPFPGWFLACLLIPASQTAVAVVNLLIGNFLPPRNQPRMDFRTGIPDSAQTVVVTPTLLLSTGGIERLVGNLEIYYLANRSANLKFGLLTDFADADAETRQGDDELLATAIAATAELNRRYCESGECPFFLCHRAREWNPSEAKWMGRERKRGKLEDFNRLLLGRGSAFSVTEGPVDRLAGTRYVITLDSDTQLPRDTAWKLVGVMAHPLNRPEFDARSGIVQRGYSLMQPRIGISMESAGKSRLAAIYSGQTGFDPYTKAVSDVYHDLFGRATFTGKGIYDVAAFDRATEGRFPVNTLLSHDLIEGEHVRAGLVTDLEMIDDYPATYQAFSKRKHRWVRGDWQIAMWMLPRVPDEKWRWFPNPLPAGSRWKVFDNLRRSLVEIGYLAAVLAAVLLLGDDTLAGLIATVAVLLLPAYVELAVALLRLPPMRFVRRWAWTRFSDFTRAHMDALLTLVFLPAQALLMADAIVRTLYRRIASRRNLLEWESMAQSEMSRGNRFEAAMLLQPARLVAWVRAWSLPERCLALASALGAVLWIALIWQPYGADGAALLMAMAWFASPGVVIWLNATAAVHEAPEKDLQFLRGFALATWRYFLDHERAEDHWLAPDNVQEDPPAWAHRSSPTNIGLQLNAALAAHEFGYLTTRETVDRISRVHATMARLERERGHFFNWYDTRTLQVLEPRFVSTVDSGNLAASLITQRQGCLELHEKPVLGPRVMAGLRDHLDRLWSVIPVSSRTTTMIRLAESFRRQCGQTPEDLFHWENALTDLAELARRIAEPINAAAVKMEPRAPEPAREMRYWCAALESRVKAHLSELCSLAPWLCGAFENELRLALNNPRLAPLVNVLRPEPRFKQLGAVYHSALRAIEEIKRDSERVHHSTVSTLRLLEPAIDEARRRWGHLEHAIDLEADVAGEMAQAMDFAFLVDERRKLLSIGWDAVEKKLALSNYDLLASEARTAVFLAIARGDAPRESWFTLGRKLTYYRGHRTLLSWSGTMFEYLMPSLFMQTWPGTLLGESLKSVVRIQRLYARERRIPWGISESAHGGRDGALNYQYKAFGIPCCGLDRIAPEDIVVAPYATMLSLMVEPEEAVKNLREMFDRGWAGHFGFYEAIDFRKRGRMSQRRPEVIRAFMAHHQGMSFLALANTLLDNPVRRWFHADPMVMATEVLLSERMPVIAEANAPEPDFPGLEQLNGAAESTSAAPLEAETISG